MRADRLKYAGDLLAALQHKAGWSIEKACDFLESIPDADLVKCKDCKHWDGCNSCDCHAADENGTPIFMRDNDFCSYGERRC